MKLNQYQHEALIGITLGDGHLRRTISPIKKSWSNTYLTITFAEKFRPFAINIFKLFEGYWRPSGFRTSSVQSGKNSPFYKRITLVSSTLPMFNFYHSLFYKLLDNGKFVKYIPNNIEELLTPISLAYFIMGDGTYNKTNKVFRLCTHSFSKKEVEFISIVIYNKFGIINKLEHARNKQYMLRIRGAELIKLQDVVKVHIIPSMLYRIGL